MSLENRLPGEKFRLVLLTVMLKIFLFLSVHLPITSRQIEKTRHASETENVPSVECLRFEKNGGVQSAPALAVEVNAAPLICHQIGWSGQPGIPAGKASVGIRLPATGSTTTSSQYHQR